jgi:hypothetical protein
MILGLIISAVRRLLPVHFSNGVAIRQQFCVAASIATVQKRTESIYYLPIRRRKVFGSIIGRIAIPRMPLQPVLRFRLAFRKRDTRV